MPFSFTHNFPHRPATRDDARAVDKLDEAGVEFPAREHAAMLPFPLRQPRLDSPHVSWLHPGAKTRRLQPGSSMNLPPSRSYAAAMVTMTNLLVGVLLLAATLPIGTSTLASGK